MWGRYGALLQHELIRLFLEETNVFHTVVQHQGTALAMAHFKAREVEMRERGYAILEDMADPTNATYIGNAKLPFELPGTLPAETIYQFFITVEGSLNRQDVLRSTTKESDWWPIFNYAV